LKNSGLPVVKKISSAQIAIMTGVSGLFCQAVKIALPVYNFAEMQGFPHVDTRVDAKKKPAWRVPDGFCIFHP